MSIERRELFKIIAAGTLAAPAQAARAPFFTPEQQALLDRLSDIIIPSDEQSPGAHEAGVAGYLEVLAAVSAPQRQKHWVDGIAAVEAASRQKFLMPFAGLSRAQQEELVALMAKNEGSAQTALERFFEMLKPAVVDGYRYSEIGVRQYMRWAGNGYETDGWHGACNHPEHQHERKV